jgi:hypothetical protein
VQQISQGLFIFACCTSENKKALANFTCDDHKKIAVTLNDFPGKIFDSGYGNMADPTPALAQLFLIQNRGPGDYSKKINGAEKGYQDSLAAAKEKGCITTDYPISPISEFEQRANALLAERKKAGWVSQSNKN